MHTRIFHVLHQAADTHFVAVAHGVNVHFHGIVEEVIEQHGAVFTHHDGFVHVARQFLGIVHNVHRAAAEHITRTHHDRIADTFGRFQSRFLRMAGGVGRLTQTEFVDELLEALAVLGAINGVGTRADTPSGFSMRQISSTSSSVTGSKYKRSDVS